MKTSNPLPPDAIKILDAAIELCQAAKWSTCEPNGVLTAAAASLGMTHRSDYIVEIQRREQQYAPTGALYNHFAVRMSALSAVRRFDKR